VAYIQQIPTGTQPVADLEKRLIIAHGTVVDRLSRLFDEVAGSVASWRDFSELGSLLCAH